MTTSVPGHPRATASASSGMTMTSSTTTLGTTVRTDTTARAVIATAVGAATDGPGAVEKSFLVLEHLPGDGKVIGVSELARRTGLSKTTAHRILGLLTGLGLADHPAGGYRLGRRIVDIVAQTPCVRTQALRDQLLPYLLDLYRLTDEAVHLGVLREQGVLCLERLYGHRSAPLPLRIGSILPLHATALGKALLAFTDESLHSRGLAGDLPAVTSRTLATGTLLRTELDQVRGRGVAVDQCEFKQGVACVAVPLWGRGRTLAGAVSVCGPAHRLDVERTARELRRVAYEASRALAATVCGADATVHELPPATPL
ncbi:IclR family transcriptional regulator [Streptomyces sp. NPDC017638]|uniref:IclR family transcriptional regulator n=2 Tax=unclassified Streptomyces TaxID=2593676 RepID=UPI0037BA3DC0